MNILVFNWRDPFHPLAGGAEISLYEHVRCWKDKGAKITWFGAAFQNAKEKETIDGINFIRKGGHYSVHFWGFLYYILGKFTKPDIIIDSFHFIPFFTPLYVRKTLIVALINEVAKETWFKNLSLPMSFVGYIIEPFFFLLYKSKKFITGSNSCREDLIKIGIKKDNIFIVPHGIKIIKDNSKKNSIPTVIFLSRISKDKGIEDAIQAISQVKENIPNIKFWVVGKAENEGYLLNIKNMIRQFNILDNTTVYGYVSEEKKFELLKKAWILIHPSIREGWGLNVIEANAMGAPAIGYNVSGLKDSIVNGKTGILTGTNFKNMADNITNTIKDKKLYNVLSKNAKKWSKNFSWEKSANKSWEIINNFSRDFK